MRMLLGEVRIPWNLRYSHAAEFVVVACASCGDRGRIDVVVGHGDYCSWGNLSLSLARTRAAFSSLASSARVEKSVKNAIQLLAVSSLIEDYILHDESQGEDFLDERKEDWVWIARSRDGGLAAEFRRLQARRLGCILNQGQLLPGEAEILIRTRWS